MTSSLNTCWRQAHSAQDHLGWVCLGAYSTSALETAIQRYPNSSLQSHSSAQPHLSANPQYCWCRLSCSEYAPEGENPCLNVMSWGHGGEETKDEEPVPVNYQTLSIFPVMPQL